MDTTELLNERGKTHGDWDKQSMTSHKIKKIIEIYGGDNLHPNKSEALDMIAVKISRILCGDADVRDHWDDIAGYAKLAADRCSK